MYPGILVQMITTKRPTDDMIEVAICSMEEALVADGNRVPAGSADLPRDRRCSSRGPPAGEPAPDLHDVAAVAEPDEPPALT